MRHCLKLEHCMSDNLIDDHTAEHSPPKLLDRNRTAAASRALGQLLTAAGSARAQLGHAARSCTACTRTLLELPGTGRSQILQYQQSVRAALSPTIIETETDSERHRHSDTHRETWKYGERH